MSRQCPKCLTKEYNNRNMVMMINECGHPLCKNCVETIFARNVAPCHQCGKTLKKNTFWEQMFDDPMIEKENFIRKKLKKIYNLKEDDFPSLREFNDYLERFETIIFNLTNGIDVAETELEVKEFQIRNAELIERNRKRLDADDLWIKEMLEEESMRVKRLQDEAMLENTVPSNESKAKQIINELRQTDLPAEVILDRQRKLQIEAELAEKEAAKKKKEAKIVQQRRMQETASFGPLRTAGAPYVHRVPELPLNGPKLPRIEDLANLGYLSHIRMPSVGRVAGGYVAEIGCMRALIDSRQDLCT
uniref:RING-type domain-containing protein n=1 Tax=Acrobeloides nanus TaxID=290746 RepID=A0A914E3F9_9BILA